MAFDSSAVFDSKDPSFKTREQRAIDAVRQAINRKGKVLNIEELQDIQAILQDVDDYTKGTTTGLNTAQTNYQTWLTKPKR